MIFVFEKLLLNFYVFQEVLLFPAMKPEEANRTAAPETAASQQ